MDNSNWSLIYTTNIAVQAEIVKQMLASNGIEATILNKQDSSYLTFGEVEVYVLSESVDTAQKLIEGIEI
jgi:hypothetical protein